MTALKILEQLGYAEEDDIVIMDGHDNAIMGVVESFGDGPRLCYDQAMVIKNLQSQGMSEEEAWEWYDYNILGAYVGPGMPVFLITIKGEKGEN